MNPPSRPGLAFVGVGPGDPELVTLGAARRLGAADVVAYFSGPSGRSNARTIAASLIPTGAVEELLRYPVTTQTTDHPGGYHAAMAEFYDGAAVRLRRHVEAGRRVVVLAEGDPLFFSTSMYLHDRLADLRPEIVPGVTSVQGATAAAATALSRHEDVVTVLPGTLPVPELAWRLAQTEAAVVMKLGRTFPGVREALRQAGRLDAAVYVERASWDTERVLPVADVDPTSVPYFSLILVPGRDRRADAAGRADGGERADGAERTEGGTAGTPGATATAAGSVVVIGLGPGPRRWRTLEVEEALARVEHVYGYAPYVERVPPRPGLHRHPSGNTVEVDRAAEALAMARTGARVAVVSGGDAGVFGMAAAVFEAVERLTAADPGYAGVDVQVLPGVSAAQAVAALAGAPLGGDFAVISLSDRLKPWDVVAERLRAAARADLVLALYNPRSRSRPDQLGRAIAVLSEVRDRDTVVVVGRDVGRAEESLTVTTLGELDPAAVDMKCLVLIGASRTRVTAEGRVWTPRFVN